MKKLILLMGFGILFSCDIQTKTRKEGNIEVNVESGKTSLQLEKGEEFISFKPDGREIGLVWIETRKENGVISLKPIHSNGPVTWNIEIIPYTEE